MPEIVLDDVSKRYDDVPALVDLDLRIRDGEFLVAIGPSGSGKTTLLRVIAGLDKQTAGHVSIGGTVVDHVPASRRGIALLSQEMALYPHLSVRGNLEFPLKVRRAAEDEVAARVESIARELRMTRQLDRQPGRLSAGERQAAATGRALVAASPVVLLDEPFAQADARARRRLRRELRDLREIEAATVVLATNDQDTAMSLGDRLAVLDGGRLQQLAPPRQVYRYPANTFVASFLGWMNLMWGELDRSDAGVRLRLGSRVVDVPDDAVPERFIDQPIIAGLRPEALRYGSAARSSSAPEQRLGGVVIATEYLGDEQIVHIATDIPGVDTGRDAELRVRLSSEVAVVEGAHLALAFDPGQLRFFNPTDGWAVVA